MTAGERRVAQVWCLGRLDYLFEINEDVDPVVNTTTGPLTRHDPVFAVMYVDGTGGWIVTQLGHDNHIPAYPAPASIHPKWVNFYDLNHSEKAVFPFCRSCFRMAYLWLGHHERQLSIKAGSADVVDSNGSIRSMYQTLQTLLKRDKMLYKSPATLWWGENITENPSLTPGMQRDISENTEDYMDRQGKASAVLYILKNEGKMPLWFGASPDVPIPSLPSYMLSKLKPAPNREEEVVDSPAALVKMAPRVHQQHMNIGQSLLDLPAELVQEISSYLDRYSCFSVRQTCVQLANFVPLDNAFYYRELTENNLLGFFFTFPSELGEVRNRFLNRGKAPAQWDWKSLVGKLSRWSSFADGGEFADAPDGFRNRRRLWRLLELLEMEGSKLQHLPGLTDVVEEELKPNQSIDLLYVM